MCQSMLLQGLWPMEQYHVQPRQLSQLHIHLDQPCTNRLHLLIIGSFLVPPTRYLQLLEQVVDACYHPLRALLGPFRRIRHPLTQRHMSAHRPVTVVAHWPTPLAQLQQLTHLATTDHIPVLVTITLRFLVP